MFGYTTLLLTQMLWVASALGLPLPEGQSGEAERAHHPRYNVMSPSPKPYDEGPVAQAERAAKSPAPNALYRVRPNGGRVSLTPLGATLEVSVLSPRYPSGTTLETTFGYTKAVGAFGFLRYDTRAWLADDATLRLRFPAELSFQAGLWPLEPHLTGTRTKAAGLRTVVAQQFLREPVSLALNTEIGLVRLIARDVAPNGAEGSLGDPMSGHEVLSSGVLVDARAEITATRQDDDAWGYRTSGWQTGLTGVWRAALGAPSLGLWADVGYTWPTSYGWRFDGAVRGGYRAAWPIPITSSAVATLASFGSSRSFGLGWQVLDLAELERITLEPRGRVWLDQDVHVGLDATLSLDTRLLGDRRVSVGVTAGYAQHFWHRFGVRLTP